ncbi:MAG TPA: proteasome assembly chaperone family protein [Methanocorpusculum sp.]|nr:proteasome assembly chaperone family protein [Methanocorpusculum sp.]HJJ50925.1 proteasome assembly chaperone family protein [Methanocorpusculum sp.]HJJ53873.1 proteasome assembly chaperone family protein [Methanocorpusculum sp.]
MEQVNVSWYVEDVSAHSSPVVIAGLPGVGHVGKLVVDHLVHVLSAVKVAEITSTLFPPQMYLSEEAVLRMPRNELFFVPGSENTPSVLLLAGDCQSTMPEGHYTMGDAYIRIFEILGVKRIYTLGGYGVGRMVDKPRVLAALSSTKLKDEVLASGAVLNKDEPVGGIIGAVGLLITLGRLVGMEGIALLGETSGYLVDPVSSTAVLDVLEKLTGIKADRTELADLACQMMTEVSSLASTIQRNNADDLSYIG